MQSKAKKRKNKCVRHRKIALSASEKSLTQTGDFTLHQSHI